MLPYLGLTGRILALGGRLLLATTVVVRSSHNSQQRGHHRRRHGRRIRRPVSSRLASCRSRPNRCDQAGRVSHAEVGGRKPADHDDRADRRSRRSPRRASR